MPGSASTLPTVAAHLVYGSAWTLGPPGSLSECSHWPPGSHTGLSPQALESPARITSGIASWRAVWIGMAPWSTPTPVCRTTQGSLPLAR
jgi:hypothetical protein